MFTIYTPCLVYTLSCFAGNLEGQRHSRLNEAYPKQEIQDRIGGGGTDTHLEFLRRVLQTIIKVNDEVKQLCQLFLKFSFDKL